MLAGEMMFLVLVLLGCNGKRSSEVTPADAEGTYTGYYRGGKETFDLHANGTFSQTFSNDAGVLLYTNNGKWEITSPGVILFRPWIGFRGSISNGFESYSSGDCVFRFQPSRLDIGEDDYVAVKLPANEGER
jgi:hypothetical protein